MTKTKKAGGRPPSSVPSASYTFRLPARLKARLVDAVGGPRRLPAVLIQLALWYLRTPGVKLPERPARQPEHRTDERAALS